MQLDDHRELARILHNRLAEAVHLRTDLRIDILHLDAESLRDERQRVLERISLLHRKAQVADLRMLLVDVFLRVRHAVRDLAADHHELIDLLLEPQRRGLLPHLRERRAFAAADAVVHLQDRPLAADRSVGARLRRLHQAPAQHRDDAYVQLLQEDLVDVLADRLLLRVDRLVELLLVEHRDFALRPHDVARHRLQLPVVLLRLLEQRLHRTFVDRRGLGRGVVVGRRRLRLLGLR